MPWWSMLVGVRGGRRVPLRFGIFNAVSFCFIWVLEEMPTQAAFYHDSQEAQLLQLGTMHPWGHLSFWIRFTFWQYQTSYCRLQHSQICSCMVPRIRRSPTCRYLGWPRDKREILRLRCGHRTDLPRSGSGPGRKADLCHRGVPRISMILRMTGGEYRGA